VPCRGFPLEALRRLTDATVRKWPCGVAPRRSASRSPSPPPSPPRASRLLRPPQERQALADDAAELGPSVLFFGCRSAGQDYIYQGELQAFADGGALGELHVAFSRDGPEKVYVQHHLAREGGRVWELLRKPGACLYVCGDAKAMAKDVHRALLDLVSAHGGMGAAGAEAWVKAFTDSGRYMRDVW
jgi:NADPH-ferrihemoprotein reductase